MLSHFSLLGLQVNWEKSKLAPVQIIYFLGMELDSVEQSACLTEEHAQSVLNCLNTFKGRTGVQLKLFQWLLGHMAAAASVTPLGLLHMRPLVVCLLLFSTGFTASSAQLSARLSVELCSPGLWHYYTTLRCTESEHFLWPLNRTFSG